MLDLKKLDELMKAGRWSSRSLALAAGVAQASVWRTVRGQTSPSLDTLAKICSVLEVPVRDLIVERETEAKRAA
jgi:transcriptional regulator with XRE-family HTH domain